MSVQGHWVAFDVHEDPASFWTEPIATWGEPVYPEEMDVEEQSSPDEEENGSEFLPSGSSSEQKLSLCFLIMGI